MESITDVSVRIFEMYHQLEMMQLAGIFEDSLRHAYTVHLRPGDHAIDVGAHRGLHTLPMAKAVGPRGKVFAVEAAEQTCNKLRAAVNHSEIEDCRKRVQIFQCAVSDQKGSATFNFVPQAAGLSGLKEQNYPEGAEIVSETVTVDTLDSLIADYEKIRFIKLDIEGAEFHALKGASKLLASAQPIFAMESGNAGAGERYGYSREDFFGLMESLGYDLFSALGSPFTQAGWGRPAPWYLFGVPRSDPHAYHRVVLPAIIRSLYEHLPGIHDKRA